MAYLALIISLAAMTTVIVQAINGIQRWHQIEKKVAQRKWVREQEAKLPPHVRERRIMERFYRDLEK